MINNRQQSGRRRGRGGQRQNSNSGGGSGRGPESGNRVDNRARGNAAQLLEKFKTLARDAQQAGDRVLTEYYLQFAEHYFRVLSETRARYEENNPSRARQEGSPNEDASFEGEEGDESQDEDDDFGSFRQPQRVQSQPQQQRESRPRDDRPRDDRPRDDRPRDDRQPREDRPQRDDRPRRDYGEDRGNRAAPAFEPRVEAVESDSRPPRRPLRAQPNGNANGNIRDDNEDEARLDMSVLPPALSVSAPETVADEEVTPAPRRRGRPRKDATEVPVEG